MVRVTQHCTQFIGRFFVDQLIGRFFVVAVLTFFFFDYDFLLLMFLLFLLLPFLLAGIFELARAGNIAQRCRGLCWCCVYLLCFTLFCFVSYYTFLHRVFVFILPAFIYFDILHIVCWLPNPTHWAFLVTVLTFFFFFCFC